MKKKQDNPLEVQTSRSLEKSPKQIRKPGTALKGFNTKLGKGAFFFVMVITVVVMSYFSSSIRSAHIDTAYHTAKENKLNEVANQFYKTAYEYSEKKNHVTNYVLINIENMTELSQLEVLTVSDTEFIIENAEDNENDITSWTEVQGIGVFTVDLQMAEFIRDAQRQYVLVRVGKPELTKCTVENVGKLFWRNDWRDDSVKTGVQLSLRQMSEGRQLIEDSIKQNRSFYDRALNAARSSIESLVKSWNPQLPNLLIEVEFVNIQ